MSLLGATVLTAWATLALAVLALVAAVLAFMAWRKQAREVRDQGEMLRLQAEQLAEDRKVNAEQIRVLGLQAEEFGHAAAEREREVQERRRAQAVQLYMGTTWSDADKELTGYVRNTSEQPVYDVVFLDPDPNKNEIVIGHLMPGEEVSHRYGNLHPWDVRVMPRRQLPAVTFRDRAGIRWQTWPDGRFVDLGEDPDDLGDIRRWVDPDMPGFL